MSDSPLSCELLSGGFAISAAPAAPGGPGSPAGSSAPFTLSSHQVSRIAPNSPIKKQRSLKISSRFKYALKRKDFFKCFIYFIILWRGGSGLSGGGSLCLRSQQAIRFYRPEGQRLSNLSIQSRQHDVCEAVRQKEEKKKKKTLRHYRKKKENRRKKRQMG